MTLEELVIDPEFENTLPPLTEDEFNGLESEIVSEGRLTTAITLWHNTIVDGHNRYHILQKHPEIELVTEQKDFPDRWSVICWIIDHQNSHRNLTELQKANLNATYYESKKKAHGGQIGNQNASKRSSNNCDFVFQNNKYGKTVNEVAEKFGISGRTLSDHVQFKHGIDAIRDVDPVLADDILTEKKNVTMKEVRAIGKAKEEDKPGMIAELKTGKPVTIKPKASKSKEELKADAERRQNIAKYVNHMVNGSSREATADDLISLIQDIADTTEGSLKSIINSRKKLVSENHELIIDSIDKIFTQTINNIKEIIENGNE